MTSQPNLTSQVRPIVLRETVFTSTTAQELVRRLRSDPGLMIMLIAPTETASVRAIEQVEHLLVDFGIPFTSDSVSFVKLGNGACCYIAVDVTMKHDDGPLARLREENQGAGDGGRP